RLVETDVQDQLLLHPGITEGDLLRVARHIIPIVRRELAGEARPSEQLFDGRLVVDAGLNGACQLRIDNRAFVRILCGAPGERCRPGEDNGSPELRNLHYRSSPGTPARLSVWRSCLRGRRP